MRQWSDKPLKLVDQFNSSNISTTTSSVNIHPEIAHKAINRLLMIWKSDQSDKIKQDFFQVITVSILLYGVSSYIVTCLSSYIRQTRYVGHCWRSTVELIYESTHGHVSVGPPARTYISSVQTQDELQRVIDDRDR